MIIGEIYIHYAQYAAYTSIQIVLVVFSVLLLLKSHLPLKHWVLAHAAAVLGLLFVALIRCILYFAGHEIIMPFLSREVEGGIIWGYYFLIIRFFYSIIKRYWKEMKEQQENREGVIIMGKVSGLLKEVDKMIIRLLLFFITVFLLTTLLTGCPTP